MLILKREIQTFDLNKILILSIYLTASIGLSSCQQLTQTPTAIAKVQQQENGAKVYLQGKVLKQAPFLGSAAYQLQDSSGSVWVVTTDYLPKPGEQVLIKGEIQYHNLSIAQQELGEFYVVELQQVARSVNSSPVTPLQKL
jgi:hypothetical protein